MKITVRVDPEFRGPTLVEVLPVLEDLPDPVEVPFSGSKAEHRILERFPARSFVLVVADVEERERTLWFFGCPLDLPEEDLEATKKALVSRDQQTWRPRVEGLGVARATLLLTSVVADSIRKGKRPGLAARIATDCLTLGLHPADADVLLRIRKAQRT